MSSSSSSNSAVLSISNNPFTFQPPNPNKIKEFGNYLKIAKETRGREIVYEFNLTNLWQNSEEAQKEDLREAIKKLHSKNRGETKNNGNIIRISFLKEDAQNLLTKLKEILSFDDDSILPGEEAPKDIQLEQNRAI